MAGWFKLADDFHSHPKVVAAGRNGRDVFLWALARNRAGGFDGRIPAAYFQASYLARMLLMSEREVEEGLASCEAADLLRADGRSIVIVGWDLEEWGVLTSTERVRRFRDRQRGTDNTETRGNVSRLPCNGETQERRGEEIRREEREKEEPPKVPQGGHGEFEFAEGTDAGQKAQAEGTPKPKKSKPPPETPTAEEWPDVETVLEKLSKQAGAEFRPRNPKGEPTGHVKHVLRRLRQGHTCLHLRTVVWHFGREWKDSDFAKFLRPETLFGTGKFDTYLAQAEAAWAKEQGNTGPPRAEPISRYVQSILKGAT